MSERKKLIELLQEWGNKENDGVRAESIADYLLENGVIVPRARIGESIYFVDFELNADKTDFEPKIYKTTVKDITIAYNYTMYSTSCGKTFLHSLFGELVFLTKEEAEKALKGGAE